jgi:hypothetical protein
MGMATLKIRPAAQTTSGAASTMPERLADAANLDHLHG